MYGLQDALFNSIQLYVGVIPVKVFVTWMTEYRHAIEISKAMEHLW